MDARSMTATRALYLLPALVFVVIAGYFLWGLADPSRDPSAVPSARVGNDILPFELEPVDGTGVPGLSSLDLASGEVTMVNFFASWCVPCRAEHPFLMRLAEEGMVRLVGINYTDRPQAAVQWLEELGNPYSHIGSDLSGRAGIDWGVSGVPETFIVDGNGKIVHQQIGPIFPEILENEILPLIEDLRG